MIRHWRAKPRHIAFFVGLSLAASHPAETAKERPEWTAPVNLGPNVNSTFEEFLPEMSKDGLSLYFSSNRPGLFGGEDLWVSQRATRDDAWGQPSSLESNINTSFSERSPALSRDSHLLFFASNRPGGYGGLDIWVSWRAHTHDDFGWQPPANLGVGINGVAGEFGPSYFENEESGVPNLFFASGRPGGIGAIDIYRSERLINGSFGPALLVPELSTPQNDFRPTIRHDGLELFFDSNRPGPPGITGIGLRDLWVSTRETLAGAWAIPENLGAIVNSESNDAFASLSSDGATLIFTSDRPGGLGGNDLYMTSRGKVH
jgi:Tol biopolymer transport system component